jgi:DNA topoisomerase-1
LKIGKNNFKLPKGTEAEKLSLEECLQIAESQGTTSKKSAPKKSAPKKTARKK